MEAEAKKVPKYRELRISETPEGVVVDFFPDLFVAPVITGEPTESNPDIKIDLARVGGALAPVKAHYPAGTTAEEIMDRVDLLFSKIEHCPSCERRKREVLEKLRRMMAEKGKGDLFDRMVQRAKVREEVTPPPPAPALAPETEWRMAREIEAKLGPLTEQTQANVLQAVDDAYVMVRGFFVPPVKLVRPDDWLRMVREGER